MRTEFMLGQRLHAHLAPQVLTGSPSLSLLCSRGNVSGDFFARRVLQMEPTTALPGSHN